VSANAPRAWSVAAVATVVVLLVGCGGGSSSSSSKPDQTTTFKNGYQPLVNQLKDTTVTIAGAIQSASSKTDAQLKTRFQGLAGRWQDELSRLETLKPPSKMAVDFNTLKGSASRVESDLNAIVAAAATHQSQPAAQASATLVNDALATKNAAIKLNKQLGIK
jgi:hypothetical protein